MLKKFTAIVLLVLLSFQQSPVFEILKLPVLIAHFFEHHEHDHWDLGEFFTEHYGDHAQKRHGDDSRLPFKSSFPGPVLGIAGIQNDLPPSTLVLPMWVCISSPQFLEPDCKNPFAFRIFQPPRFS